MKREHSYIIGALALAGAILLAEADTVKNGFVEVVGEGARANGDRDVVLHEPEDPSEVKVSTQAGWRFTDPQDAAFLHHVGATDLIHLVNESKESEATIKITDDWEHTCEKTNWEEHVSAPKLVVGGADHALILLKPDEVGVFLETNCTASAGEDGIHNVWTECKPCRHPDCRGRNPLKWMEEKKIHAPDQVEGTVRASGRILVDPDRDDGYYLLEGPHELSYVASFDLEECEEHLCVGGAVTNTTWDVCRLSVTNTPYLGIDLTDEGKKTNAVGIAEARYGYRPKNTTASYQWEFISPRHGVIASQDDEKGTARLESARPAEPSDTYQGDQVICHATLTETNPPDGHNPCVASADVTSPVTVVRVDVVMDDVEEDKEETEGAMLYYIPDAENGEWTEEGTNELRKIRFVCEPDDGEMLKHEIAVTAPEGLLFEKVGKEYQPANETYTVEELNKKEFRVHGHRRSEKYLGDEIEAVHLPSGAKDKVKLTIFGRPLLVPDYDRKNGIDKTDVAKAKEGKTVFRFWINDDKDYGEACPGEDYNSDLPGKGNNCGDAVVNGRRDLEDFTPIWIMHGGVKEQDGAESEDAGEIWPKETPPEFIASLTWKLESPHVNAVQTGMFTTEAGDFQHNPKVNCGSNMQKPIEEADIVKEAFTKHFIEAMNQEPLKGVFIMEGAGVGSNLVLRIATPRGKTVTKTSMPLVVSSVNAMYRWINLRGLLDGNNIGEDTKTDEPKNRPDAECNGKHVVFVHGYNTNAAEARSMSGEMFKRLWQSGFKAMFTAVDWFGDKGQIDTWNWKGTITPEYYAAVYNAFKVSKKLSTHCDNLPGTKVMMAHSLGNVLVCAAAKDHGLAYSKYIMINGAVAQEALNSKLIEDDMIDNDWKPGGSWAEDKKTGLERYRSSRWHGLFDAPDFRRTLSWKGRFSGLRDVINYYAETDEVVGDPARLLINSSAWVQQERRKGTTSIKGAYALSFGKWNLGCEAGWGINTYYALNPIYYVWPVGFLRPSGLLTREDVIIHPLFTPFRNVEALMHSTDLFSEKGRDPDDLYLLRALFLSDAIPAESHAMGANELILICQNVPMLKNIANKETWPHTKTGLVNLWSEKTPQWYHADIKNLAYFYAYKVFDDMTKKME